MSNYKHLALDDCSYIQHSLNEGVSLRQIARHLDKDPSTISKEIRLHRIRIDSYAVGRVHNRCVYRMTCHISGICARKDCKLEFCRSCNQCNSLCEKYVEEICSLPSNPPYVCNGCSKMHKRQCSFIKYEYKALSAHKKYQENLSSSREGIFLPEEEVQWLDQFITPLVMNDQSPIKTFSFFYGEEVLRKLGFSVIPPDQVILSPALLKQQKDQLSNVKGKIFVLLSRTKTGI